MKYIWGIIMLLWGTSAAALSVAIQTTNGDIPFQVQEAFSPAQREKGLMFVRHLPEKKGMLFLFPTEQILYFWMKNTYIPLDMIFFNKEGTIMHIAPNAVPLSLDHITSVLPAQGVLEIAGGQAQTLQIQTGDKVIFDATLWDKVK